jgi:UTP--glucose-1-phosphate uridylyltransferase
MSVRKAVIPAAGLGTRFLPATKAVPKEMLPIVDVPTVQLVVEEALAAGIEQIVIVTGRGKQSIEDHFDHAFELETTLRQRSKSDLDQLVSRISTLTRIVSVRQKQPLGLGHAVLCARDVIGDEPFAVLLADDLYDADPPAIGQLMELHQATGAGVVATMQVPEGHEQMYGVIDGIAESRSRYRVNGLVEKPAPGTAPSRYAVMGRYVLPASIWGVLAETKPGRGGEIQLTDALHILALRGELQAQVVAGERFDAGDRVGYLKANLHWALKRPELRDQTLELCERALQNTMSWT